MQNKPGSILIFFLFSCLFIACKTKKPTVFKEVEMMGRFNLQIPDYLHATSGITPFRTSMEFKDDSGRMFLIVFDTSRDGIHENTLKMYYDSMVSQFMLDSAAITPAQFAKVGGDSAYKAEMTGKMQGLLIYNEVETVATQDRYYTILTWGKFDKKTDIKEDMDKILGSFSDLSQKK